jgi:hypothetical protein
MLPVISSRPSRHFFASFAVKDLFPGVLVKAFNRKVRKEIAKHAKV